MPTIHQVISAWNTFRNCRAYFFLFCLILLLVVCAFFGFIAGRVSSSWHTQFFLMLY